MKNIFCFLFIFIITIPCFGQKKLSEDDLKYLQKRAVEYVYNFEFYIQQIAQTKLLQDKKLDIISALDLFENKATLEVSNLNGNKKNFSISDYLNNIVAKYSDKYGVVVIDFQATKIEKLKQKKDDNGKIYYEGYFYFTQRFCAQKKILVRNDIEKRTFGVCDYSDVTVKMGTVNLTKITTIKGELWVIKLSDITVLETTELDSQKGF